MVIGYHVCHGANVSLFQTFLHFRNGDEGQRRRGTCGEGWAKFKDFPIKFETFILTNSESTKIFRQNIKISENLTISKKIGRTMAPCPHDAPVEGHTKYTYFLNEIWLKARLQNREGKIS